MMGTTMDKSSCQWVRGRLPLWVGFGDVARDPSGDGDDLSALDQRSIEAHLEVCAACREHRSGLASAREALGRAAVAPPLAPDTPSLWPALEQRIAASRSHDPARTSPVRESVVERARAWAALDDDRPLRAAWMQDTLREVVEAAGLRTGQVPDRPGRGHSAPSSRAARGRWWIVGSSLAASILAMLVVLPVAWRLRSAAESRIRDNTTPVAMPAGLVDSPEDEVPDLVEPAPVRPRDVPAGQLARAESVKLPADPSASPDLKSDSPLRYGYDLENGIPMPLDGRDAKPAY